MSNNRISDKISGDQGIFGLEEFLITRLELPKAVLDQMKDTHLCNELVDEALSDIEEILDKARNLTRPKKG